MRWRACRTGIHARNRYAPVGNADGGAHMALERWWFMVQVMACVAWTGHGLWSVRAVI
jgi:hypothetical protein